MAEQKKNFVVSICTKLCKQLHIKATEQQIYVLSQYIQFALVGVSNTLISYSTYFVLVQLHCNYIVANILAFIVSVTNAFYWNNKYVFEHQKHTAKTVILRYLKMVISYSATGVILSNILLFLFVNNMGIHKLLAPVFCMLITMPINFIMNKFWTFK